MSIRVVLSDRAVIWRDALEDFGWVPADIVVNPLIGQLRIRTRREPAVVGGAAVNLAVREDIRPGPDPDDLRLERDDCHIFGVSWHAQFDDDRGGLGAERFDLHRAKPRGEQIHRHPIGEINSVREYTTDMPAPAGWLHDLELVIYGRTV